MASINAANVGEWFDAHARALVLYARQWLDEEGARDAVQEAFRHVLKLREEPKNVPAWLYCTVRHAAFDALRARRRRQKRERYAAASLPLWFEPRSDDVMDAAAAQLALEKLPAEQREVIVLRLWSGLTLAEAAEVCQAPVSTVFSRYRAGLAALRKQLESSLCKPIGKTTN